MASKDSTAAAKAATGAAAAAGAGAASGVDVPAVAALFVQQSGLMHSLWAIYVVATFAAAGLAASAHTLPAWVAALATLGFWLFTLGHMSLLKQALAMLEATRADLALLAAKPGAAAREAGLGGTVATMRDIRDPYWIALVAHLGIDLCVTGILWYAVYHTLGK
ncbi:MAG: hypothetical protein JO013_13320 [Alphaproteobacteria bacterium]|nr:hypothetical protein [Alphaproteobacteria bacterium]